MQIGLIGGIGPAATDFYYRTLIQKFASGDAELDMTIVHADAPTLVKNLMSDNKDAQVAINDSAEPMHTVLIAMRITLASRMEKDGLA